MIGIETTQSVGLSFLNRNTNELVYRQEILRRQTPSAAQGSAERNLAQPSFIQAWRCVVNLRIVCFSFASVASLTF